MGNSNNAIQFFIKLQTYFSGTPLDSYFFQDTIVIRFKHMLHYNELLCQSLLENRLTF